MRRRVLPLVACAVALLAAALACAVPAAARAEEADVTPQVEVSHAAGEADGLEAEPVWQAGPLELSGSWRSARHRFDGNDVALAMTCSSAEDGTFLVELQRLGAGDVFEPVGSAAFARDGFTRATWTGVGPGTYRFVLSATEDAAPVTCSSVAAYTSERARGLMDVPTEDLLTLIGIAVATFLVINPLISFRRAEKEDAALPGDARQVARRTRLVDAAFFALWCLFLAARTLFTWVPALSELVAARPGVHDAAMVLEWVILLAWFVETVVAAAIRRRARRRAS